jgi:hypothetical protein
MLTKKIQQPTVTHSGADRLLDPQAFCRLRFSPILATGVLVHLLREHFGNPKSIVDPMVQQCVWRNDTETGIVIESSSNDVLTNVGQRPAVLVRRDAIRSLPRQSLGNEIISTGGQMGSDYGIVLQGSHTVFSISTKPGHVEALANEVSLFLTQYSPLIHHHLCLKHFQLQQIGQLSRLEGSKDQYVVPTTFSYVASFEWTLDDDLPPLRHIDMKLLFGL